MRGRKRKRNDDMGDLDVSLIKEFSKRPGFYDRNDVNFKDKLYVQKGWNEISHKLGYEVHMLKDRIYQLRNRYNLEKRRLEGLRHDSPHLKIESPWPLFSYLTFLDGHIRQRRSYKTMMRRNGSEDQPYFDNNSNNNSNIDNTNMLTNQIVTTKSVTRNERTVPSTIINTRLMETRLNSAAQISITSNSDNILVKDENESNASEEEEQNGEHYLNPANYLAEIGGSGNNDDVITVQNGAETHQSNNNTINNSEQNSQQQNIIMTNINGNRRDNITTDLTNGNSNTVAIASETNGSAGRIQVKNIESLNYRDDSHFLPPSKRHRRISRSEKYDAFGKFLSHAFCDLEEDKALKLVEKFTTEVVRALIENHNKNNTNNTDINT